VKQVCASLRTEEDLRELGRRLREASGLCNTIRKRAGEALCAKLGAKLSLRLCDAATDAPLLDCSFPPTEEGRLLFWQCSRGDLSSVFTGTDGPMKPGECVLGEGAGGKEAVELHLPLLERKWWNRRLELFTEMKARVTGEGRVHVFSDAAQDPVEAHNSHQVALMLTGSLFRGEEGPGEGFRLTCEDCRCLAASHATTALPSLLASYDFPDETVDAVHRLAVSAPRIQAALSFSIPGSLVSAWLDVPAERSLAFYGAFTGVSSAVQRCLRLWLPYAYFAEMDRYDDFDSAWPLLVYQASKPFSRRMRSEFTYDPMNPKSVSLAFSHAGRRLPGILETVEALLLRADRQQTAELYKPSQAKKIIAAVRRGPHRFNNLLASDAHLVGALVNLANRSRKLGKELKADQNRATGKVSHYVDSLAKSVHIRLRRLYGGEGYPEFGSLLFVEATRALAASLGRDAPITGVLRIRVPGEDGEHIFVNGGYRAGQR